MFLLSFVLVGAALILLIAGIATGSAGVFAVAAALSALAVVALWRTLQLHREKTFVTSPPPQPQIPTWDRPLRRRPAAPADESADVGRVAVAIPEFDELMAAEILPSLETLSVEELRAVIGRERSGLARQAVIKRAEVLIDLTLGPDAATPAAAAPGAPARSRRTPRRTPELATPERTVQEKSTPERTRRGPDLSL